MAIVQGGQERKWISAYDGRHRGAMAARQALAESRNTAAVFVAQQAGMNQMRQVARELGVTSPIAPYISSALGASEVRLLELAGAYGALASGVLATPHAISWMTDASGAVVHRAERSTVRFSTRWVARDPGRSSWDGTDSRRNRAASQWKRFPHPCHGQDRDYQ